MKNEIQIIEGQVLYPIKSGITQFVYMIGGTATSIYLARLCDFPIIGYVGIIVFLFVPAFYSKPIRTYFTKNVKITFNKDAFLIEIFNVKKGNLEKAEMYQYDDVSNCVLEGRQKGIYTAMKLYFYNRSYKRYVFVDENPDSDTSEAFYDQLMLSNDGQLGNNKIHLTASLYASKKGSYLVKAYTIIMIFLVTYQIIYSPNTLPLATIPMIGFGIHIILRQKADAEKFQRKNKS